MNVALIGLPKSGKSTVFSAVTGIPVDPHGAPEPHQGVVKVPDERLEFLAKLCKPKKIVEATIEFVDVPGVAVDEPHGQEEWRRLLPAVRRAELLAIVVRDFHNPVVPAYRNRVNGRADFEHVWDELIFADLDTVTTRLERIEKSLKKPTRTHDVEKREQAMLERCRDALEANQPLSTVLTSEEERRQLASFAFLTEKPLVGVRNVSDDKLATAEPWKVDHVYDVVTLSASIEAEIAALDPRDRAAFLADLGVATPARNRLIRECYKAGGLISFLTMGPEEARAWPIPKGTTAHEAAAKVHTDLARGFIRAETVAYDDLLAHGDMKGAKAAGKVRKEGKNYVVADGDILTILAST